MSVFVNPSTKFGFRRIFGQEDHKHLLSAFLNALYAGEFQFGDVIYHDSSVITGSEEEQRVIHGIFCSQKDGTPIILEWQNQDIVERFEERIIYFQSKAVVAQGDTLDLWKGIPVFVYMLDFEKSLFEHRFRLDAGLKQVNPPPGINPIELDRMTFLQMPNFEKPEAECVTEFERWMYILKNMAHLSEIPWTDENEIFAEIAQVMRVDALTPEELEAYQKSCAALRGAKSQEPVS